MREIRLSTGPEGIKQFNHLMFKSYLLQMVANSPNFSKETKEKLKAMINSNDIEDLQLADLIISNNMKKTYNDELAKMSKL